MSECDPSFDPPFVELPKYSPPGKMGLEIQLDSELVLELRALDLKPIELTGDSCCKESVGGS
jgi:hypothetical protein